MNYRVGKGGFTVRDIETGHVLEVTYQDGTYTGVVMMPEQGEVLPLAPWKKGANPFQEDLCFRGNQRGWSDNGQWWFSISPSKPFRELLAEVEAANTSFSFFRKKVPQVASPSLLDIVPKATKSGFVFWDINDDLGKSCEVIMKSTPHVIMAYGYARRAAMAALYLQGIAPKDSYDHACAIFRSLQSQTKTDAAFQEDAASEAVRFMGSYHHLITGLLVKTAVQASQECQPADERLNDADLFAVLADLAFSEQEARRQG